jgi:hypothetical protein
MPFVVRACVQCTLICAQAYKSEVRRLDVKLDPGPHRRMRTVSCLIVSLTGRVARKRCQILPGLSVTAITLSGVLNHWMRPPLSAAVVRRRIGRLLCRARVIHPRGCA